MLVNSKKDEKVVERRKRQFKNKIKKIFELSGFTHLNSEGKEVKIGSRNVELDAIFYYKNIILICEYTDTNAKHIKNHLRGKQEAFKEILNNRSLFLDWLSETVVDYIKDGDYDVARYVFKFLYFSQNELDFSDERIELYEPIKIIEPKDLEYFHRLAQCIQKSVKYEIYRFLDIKDSNIGNNETGKPKRDIEVTIISPGRTGIKKGIVTVSFLMSAAMLIKNAYVLRKDNWDESKYLYQRLIQKERIKKIRKFLVDRGEAFYNNVIVALPPGVVFMEHNENDKAQQIDPESIGQEHKVCTMIFPDEMNSICVIDGQHRIYAHYEGKDDDKDEPRIAKLRGNRDLLVTGIVFPAEMSPIEISKIESEIFLDINSNSKPVPPDVLLHIKGVKDPLSDVGLARSVIERLNKRGVFSRKFELSSLDSGKIKIASIIKYALRYLVSVKPQTQKSFYSIWEGDKQGLEQMKEETYNAYLGFCTKELDNYFSALKKNFAEEWNDPNSKILSVISINGFIIAYNKFIDKYGIKDFDYFNARFKALKEARGINFSKESFPYTSSQYKKFSVIIFDALSPDSSKWL